MGLVAPDWAQFHVWGHIWGLWAGPGRAKIAPSARPQRYARFSRTSGARLLAAQRGRFWAIWGRFRPAASGSGGLARELKLPLPPSLAAKSMAYLAAPPPSFFLSPVRELSSTPVREPARVWRRCAATSAWLTAVLLSLAPPCIRLHTTAHAIRCWYSGCGASSSSAAVVG